MNPADEREEVLFREALQRVAGAERGAFLDQACAGNPALRGRLDALLQAHESPDPFLEPLAAAAPGGAAPRPEEGPGTVIGRYKLLQQIGEGGCGVVYMAEQEAPMRRRVAFKIIKLGMDTKQVVARFEAERQALAMMDHPNIARVLDGGATETGRPYFVLELVRGVRITEYCDQNNLSTVERLKLFLQVCHAIQHAHQKGVIHRDIKPSNILVSLHDDVPVAKVIDFGIAKAIGHRLTDKTVFTRFEQFIGTPAYMSPEQAGVSGLDIDTRSDIYALGVLLYELLTGRTPFDPKQLAEAGLEEILRRIREEEPPKPSTRLSTLAREELTTTAQRRQTEPPRLISLLRGDLDWIVMKCLEKNRTRRYETANALARDIEHHLNQEPVTAAAPSTLYRAGKFVRRHKAGLAATTALVLLLAAGATVSTWQAVRATRAEREQTRLRKAAETARQQVEARAYASDMSLAAHSADSGGNLGNVQHLLSRWRHTIPDRRGWEWYYLNGLCHRDVLTINADTKGVQSVAWSPDGGRLASGGRDDSVRIWDASTGRKITELHGHTDLIRCVAWHPDGRRLASSSGEGMILVWDPDTAKAVLRLAGHRDNVFSVAWSRDGTKLASASQDRTVRIWDAATGAQVMTVLIEEPLRGVCWHADGTRLAVCSALTTIVLDTATGNRLLTLSDGGAGWSVTWSPDGKWLATGGTFSWARITDAATGMTMTVGRHEGTVSCVAWSPDGRRLVSSSLGDGTVKVGDVQSGAEVQSFRGHAGAVLSVAWRPDGKQVASAGLDGTIKVWDVNSDDACVTVRTQPGQVMSLAWHADGNQLASSASDGSVRIWDTANAREPILLDGHTSWVWQVAWNPTGMELASGGWDGLIKLWKATNGGELWSVQASRGLPGDRKDVRSLAWSPDGTRLASVAQDGYLKIWETSTGALLAAHDLRGMTSLAVAWSPDGGRLAIGLAKGKVAEIGVLDAISGKPQRALRGHREGIRSLAWSPDGKRLASASDDTTARVWDPEAAREIHTLVGHSSQVRSVAWNPDGKRLATGSCDRTFRIWDPAIGEEVCSLIESVRTIHSLGCVFAVAWSPDGTRVASAEQGGNIRIHDCTPGRAAEEKQERTEFEQAEPRTQPAAPPR
jgi:eukaryotic-like serine/threonine-protein kinase